MAYQKLPGIYRKEDSPTKQVHQHPGYKGVHNTLLDHDNPPTKHIGGGAPWWGLNKGNKEPVFHAHPHGSKGVAKLMKEDVKNVSKAIGKAGKWVGKGIGKAWKNRPKMKIRLRGGVRPGKTPF